MFDKRLLVITITIFIAAIVLVAAYLFRQQDSHDNNWHLIELVAHDTASHLDWAVVAAYLSDYPSVTQKSGHPHSPLGMAGNNQYDYNGEVKFDGHIVELRCSTFSPYAVIRIEDQYLMLLRHYFNHTDFEFRASNGTSSFETIRFTSLPPRLADLRFVTRRTTLAYRVWWLTALAKSNKWTSLRMSLSSYIDKDARSMCFGDYERPAWHIVRYCDLLKLLESTTEPLLLSEQLKRIVEALKPKDNMNGIECLLMAILSLDPDNGLRWECDYKSRVTSAFGADDNRVQVCETNQKLSQIECQDAHTGN